MAREIIEDGLRILVADEGEGILVSGEVVSRIILGKFTLSSDFEIVQLDDYEDTTRVVSIKTPLDVLKVNQIKLSKKNLAKYLEEHPLLSTCKYKEGKYYNITEEKQNQLTSTLASYMSDILPQLVIGMSTAQVTITSMEQFLLTLDNLPQTITWNDTGGICETYSYKELYTLKCEIMETVKPLVSLQQTMEVTINKCVTQEEVLNVNVEYTDEQVKKWLETHTL